MKIFIYYLLLFFILTNNINSIALNAKTMTALKFLMSSLLKLENKFRDNDKPSLNTLSNPLRLFKLNQEKQIFVKMKYFWGGKNISANNEISKFNYKLIQISKETVIAYSIDQTILNASKNDVSSTNYLHTIRTQNIDLPCNGNMYICTYGEFKREYKNKLLKTDMSIPKQVSSSYSVSQAEKQCLILTTGPFYSLSEVGWLCSDSLEDSIFYQSFISEKIIENIDGKYSGQIIMVNEVKISFKFFIFIY